MHQATHSGTPFSIINGPKHSAMCTFPKGIFSDIDFMAGSRIDFAILRLDGRLPSVFDRECEMWRNRELLWDARERTDRVSLRSSSGVFSMARVLHCTRSAYRALTCSGARLNSVQSDAWFNFSVSVNG